MHPFNSHAPKFWAKGIPVIPLYPLEKRPAINGWQRFAAEKATEEEKAAWLSAFPNGNIGLPLGPSAGVVAFDVDTDNEDIIRALEAVLPPSPWTRVGKKGYVKLYRFNGERTTRFRNSTGTFCEVLSVGSQVVLPPSIHPDTKRPYEANCDLAEVYSALPALPNGWADLIRSALKSVGIEVGSGSGNHLKTLDFVAAGSRDSEMVYRAGLMARAVEKGERTLRQVLGEMEHWVTNFVEQVAGDPLHVGKAQAKLIEFLVKDVTGNRRVGLPVGWDDGLTVEDKEKLGLSFTEDHEKWTATHVLEEFLADWETSNGTNSLELREAVVRALERLARSDEDIRGLDVRHVFGVIADKSPFRVSDLTAQLKAMRQGDFAGENHSEIAEKLLEMLGVYGEIRFADGALHQWKGAHWQQMENAELLKFIAEEFGHCRAARHANDHKGVLTVVCNLSSRALGSGTRGMNFANGFLNERLELVPHHPDQGMKYVLPFPYRILPVNEEGAIDLFEHAPRFAKLLVDAWSRDHDYWEKVLALQEAMGATVFGAAPRYQRAFCLHGPGGTGKSQLIEVVQTLLPSEAVSSIPPHEWHDRFLPAEMAGKLMNFAGELSGTRQIVGEAFKGFVTGETQTVQRKGKDPFGFNPTAAQWFGTNHLPKSRDFSSGFNRRWLMFQFTQPIPVGNRIPDLAKLVVAEEREAIAAWAAQGYERLRVNGGYTLPASHHDLVNQMANANNPVRHFLREANTIRWGEGSASLSALYGAFMPFRIRVGGGGVAVSDFKARLEELAEEFGFHVSDGVGHGHMEPMITGLTVVMH